MCYCRPEVRTPYCNNCPSAMHEEITRLNNAFETHHKQLTLEQLRLQWIARQGSDYLQGMLIDQPGDGDFVVWGMNGGGQGRTFLEALDNAMKE